MHHKRKCSLNIKGHIIKTDAMGTQIEIARRIKKRKADYVLALIGNQGTLHEDVKKYFAALKLLEGCAYTGSMEKIAEGLKNRNTGKRKILADCTKGKSGWD